MLKHSQHSAGQNSAHDTIVIILSNIFKKVKSCSDYFKFTLEEDDELSPFKD